MKPFYRKLDQWRFGVLTKLRHSEFLANVYALIELSIVRLLSNTSAKYAAVSHACAAIRRIPRLAHTRRHREAIRKLTGQDSKQLGTNDAGTLLTESFKNSRYFRTAFTEFRHNPISDRVRLRYSKETSDETRQGNLILLKAPDHSPNEKGVLLVKYTPSFEQLAAQFDLDRLLRKHRIVFEPSSYRNIEPALFLFAANGSRHIFQAAHIDDRIVANELLPTFKCIDLGSADWLDPTQFHAPLDTDKKYDAAMIASWSKLKRHDIAFAAIRRILEKKPSFRAVFIGYTSDMRLSDVRKIAAAIGVEDACTFFEDIPRATVSEILSQSRLALHLSEAEGTNKASYEAWLCDIPLIVYARNQGFRLDYITNRTGMLTEYDSLDNTILEALDNLDQFAPRSWILKRSGCEVATRTLNNALKEIAFSCGEPWTTPIVAKRNNPNLEYVHLSDLRKLSQTYEDLRAFLR